MEKHMRKYPVLAALVALGAGGPAVAAGDFSYTNVEAAYIPEKFDGTGVDSNGFSVSGSFAFSDYLFAFATINDLDGERDEGVSTAAMALGVGFSWALAPSLDVVTGLSSYLHVRFRQIDPFGEEGTGSAREQGAGLSVGLRGRVGERLELTGGVKYSDFGHGVHDYSWSAGARAYLTRTFAAGVDVSDNDDGTVWGIVLRYDFGARD
jgi:hypothetical protein